MRTAAEKFAIALDDVDFNLPSIPVLQNTTMTSPSSIEDMTMALQAQLHSPVPWVNTIHTINAQAECIIEMGPGKVLTGLNKRIDKTIKSVCVFDNASLEQAIKIIEE
jgi:[acyl-carrier-protein] S-malonyltransferase